MRVAGKSGFTLVEVMLSSIILVIVSSGIIAGIISALKTQANSADHYRATCIARNRIQHARTIAFDSYSLLVESNITVDGDGNLCQTGEYVRTTSISNVTTNCVSISAKVWYQVAPGQMCDQPVQIQTMITSQM